MDTSILQQRAFILSSLRRLQIPITTYAYRFADKMIQEGWMPPLGSLEEVDRSMQIKYQEFMGA